MKKSFSLQIYNYTEPHCEYRTLGGTVMYSLSFLPHEQASKRRILLRLSSSRLSLVINFPERRATLSHDYAIITSLGIIPRHRCCGVTAFSQTQWRWTSNKTHQTSCPFVLLLVLTMCRLAPY